MEFDGYIGHGVAVAGHSNVVESALDLNMNGFDRGEGVAGSLLQGHDAFCKLCHVTKHLVRKDFGVVAVGFLFGRDVVVLGGGLLGLLSRVQKVREMRYVLGLSESCLLPGKTCLTRSHIVQVYTKRSWCLAPSCLSAYTETHQSPPRPPFPPSVSGLLHRITKKKLPPT